MHTYIKGTSIKELYELKKFDDKLRMHLLKYVTKVEEEVRTITGHRFDEVNKHGKVRWYEGLQLIVLKVMQKKL